MSQIARQDHTWSADDLGRMETGRRQTSLDRALTDLMRAAYSGLDEGTVVDSTTVRLSVEVIHHRPERSRNEPAHPQS